MKNVFRPGLLALALCSAIATTAQVPLLNSYPSASAVIFLDFDGHVVDGTSWNYAGPINCGPSGLDNAQITSVFNRIAEDYRPFNVNITTDQAKFLAAPANMRMRVILTVTSDWYGAAGGVAFVNSFTWGDDTPCFVFTALLNYNVKNISESAAHEAGHTLGLYHQSTYDANCNKISDYNYGVGTGEIGWAPIMGVGYYQNFTLWNNGPNSFGCTNYQSDLSVITTNSGFSYRPDDHGNTFATAGTASFANNRFTVNGVIERSTDQDYIRFTQPVTGRFQLDAIPYNVGAGNTGSDLDMQVTLFNASQTQLNVYNPGNLLNSVIDTTLGAGTYYLRVEGRGNMYAPNYASLGSYALQANNGTGNPLPLRRLELRGEVSGERHRLNWIIEADEQVTEQILEISTDGVHFAPLNHSDNNDRLFQYRPNVTTTAQYRLNVTFDNGRQYYSNIVSLRATGNKPRPQLVSNLVAGSSAGVTSPGNYDYMIYDMNGKTVGKGQLKNGMNNIPVAAATGGMYFIRYVNGTEQWTEKFIRH